MWREALAMLALVPLLGACASAGGGVPVRAPAGPPKKAEPALTVPARPPEKMGPREAVVHMMPGLEGVIGGTPAQLVRQFGQPRLDVWEGDARKLQFSGAACVLDVYLYPKTRGAEPQATYVEARQPAGGDADRASCVAALRQTPAGAPAKP